MPRGARHDGLVGTPEGRARVAPENGPQHLLRYSHIFASAVREVLEFKPLREVTGTPLSPTQFRLLALARRSRQHHVRSMAGLLGVSPPAATKNIDKLERLGLVSRSPSTGDRRATTLAVSVRGRELVRQYEKRKAQRLSAALSRFQPAEVEQFTDLLKRFSLALLASDSPRSTSCLRCAAQIEVDCPVGQMHGGCPCSQADITRPARRPVDAGASAHRRQRGQRPKGA